MRDGDEELSQLLDEAVERLSSARRTFTDEEALAEIWKCNYDLSPQADPQGRFVLAYEADGKHPRQWRLATQALANNRLLDALKVGAWDGQDLDAELVRLGAEDHTHYIYCPADPRFTTLPDGTLVAADQEYNLTLPPETQAALDTLGHQLLEHWDREGVGPLTVRQMTEYLGKLGWPEASARNGWLLVRAWLLRWPEVVRVGVDYWVPTTSLPQGPEHTRLQVLPVASQTAPTEPPQGETNPTEVPSASEREAAPTIDKSQVIHSKAVIAHVVSWPTQLRTIHLLEGFLPVPSTARSAFPPRGVGEGDTTILRGLWYDSDEPLWLWLDRAHDRLYGPDLVHQLEWREPGDVLRVEWRPEVLVLRMVGHNDEVQREETRLVDPQALKALRGGLGESYRQSLQAILLEKTEGLTFAHVVKALRERQGHDIHRGTVRALLSAGGFIQRDGHWFAAPQSEVGARKLRAALMETLVQNEQAEQAKELITDSERQRQKIRVIRARLAQVIRELQKSV